MSVSMAEPREHKLEDLLLSILKDNYLSEENKRQACVLLGIARPQSADKQAELDNLLESCRQEFDAGNTTAAITRYYSSTGLSLRECHDAISRGKKV